jgi:hypothetical protein
MLKHYPRYIVISILKIYQKTFSFDHGFLKVFFPHGYCRFRPTCSDYAVQSIEKFGVIKGGLRAFWRVMRCNPWNKGGWDPIK